MKTMNITRGLMLTAVCLLMSISATSQSLVRYILPGDLDSKALYADSVLTSITLPWGVSRIDNNREFQDAASELSDILYDRNSRILSVYVCGSTSPDGLWQENVALSQARTNAAVRYLKNVTGIPSYLIHAESLNEDWDRLYDLVEESDIPYREQVLDIIRTKTWGERKRALQTLGGGKVWRILLDDYFPKLRCIRVAIYCHWDPTKPYMSAPRPFAAAPVSDCAKTVSAPACSQDSPVDVSVKVDTMYVRDTVYIRDTVYVSKEIIYLTDTPKKFKDVYESYRPVRKQRVPVYYDTPWMMGVKTNLLADAMVIPSLGMEIQLSRLLSLDLQGWYTGTNIFCKNTNTNVYGFCPELRLWTGDRAMQKGSFFGIHARMAWYTLQWTDGYMYQNGKEGAYSTNAGNHTPAWSIGLTYGYSMSLDRKDRWGLEFLLGLGYGRYEQNLGEWNADDQKWYFNSHQNNAHIGITRAAINLTYRFSVRKVKPGYYNE